MKFCKIPLESGKNYTYAGFGKRKPYFTDKDGNEIKAEPAAIGSQNTFKVPDGACWFGLKQGVAE